VQIIKAERYIRMVAVRCLHAAESAFGYKNVRRHLVRAEQAEPIVLEHFAHPRQQMVVAPAIRGNHPRQNAEPFEVGMHLPERGPHQ
jgi:hypothetical protein